MKKSRFSDSQILAILKQAESGTPVANLCREHGVKQRAKLSRLGVETASKSFHPIVSSSGVLAGVYYVDIIVEIRRRHSAHHQSSAGKGR